MDEAQKEEKPPILQRLTCETDYHLLPLEQVMPDWQPINVKSEQLERILHENEVLYVEEDDFWDYTEDGPDPPLMGSRREHSLYHLTQRFINIIQEKKVISCDLNEMTLELGIKQKRRLYDLTNVMEGIGLVEKTNMGTIRWNGGQDFLHPDRAHSDSVTEGFLKRKREEISQLKEEEELLDKRIDMVKKNIGEIFRAPENANHVYLTAVDLLAAFPDKKTFAFKFVNGGLLTTPPEQWMHTVTMHHLWIRGRSRPLVGHYITTAGALGNNTEFCSNIPEFYGRLNRNPFEWPEHEDGRKKFYSFFPKNDHDNMRPEMRGRPIMIPLSPPLAVDYPHHHEGPSILDLYGTDGAVF